MGKGTIAVLIVIVATGCGHNANVPKIDSKKYRELVSAFYVGLAGLQTGEDVRAKSRLTVATQIAPGEPASWANLGLLAVRQQEFESAYADVEKARALAPDNSRIEALLGLIESKRGRLPEAIAHLKKAVELDPGNLKAMYALAQETERQAAATSDADAEKLFAKILDRQPNNLAVLLDVARLAAKMGDTATLQKSVATIAGQSASWPDEVRQRVTKLQQAASGANPRAAAVPAAFLRNMLARVLAYRQSLDAVKTPAVFVGEPFLKFIKLPSPSSEPAPPDMSVTFEAQPVPGVRDRAISWIGTLPLDASGNASILWADQSGVQILGGARLQYPGALSRNGVLGADLNYDFKTDLVLAGAHGVRIYLQQDPSHFTDITASSRVPPNVMKGSYLGAWGVRCRSRRGFGRGAGRRWRRAGSAEEQWRQYLRGHTAFQGRDQPGFIFQRGYRRRRRSGCCHDRQRRQAARLQQRTAGRVPAPRGSAESEYRPSAGCHRGRYRWRWIAGFHRPAGRWLSHSIIRQKCRTGLGRC